MGWLFNNLCAIDSYVDKAAFIAVNAHTGDTDLDGNPTVFHAFAVGAMGRTKDEQIVGLLHDVFEDTDYIDFDDLLNFGFRQHIVEALKLLTHTKDMTYQQYLERIKNSENRLALNVKLNDLQHNLKRGRAGGHKKQVQKHEKALRYLVCGNEPLINEKGMTIIRGCKYRWACTTGAMPAQYYIYDGDTCLAYFRVDNYVMQLHRFETREDPIGELIYEKSGQWFGSLAEDEIPEIVVEIENELEKLNCKRNK